MIKRLPLKMLLQKNLCLFLVAGFSNLAICQAPVVTSFSPFGGTVGTLVTITGTNLGSPTAVNIGGKPAIVVSSSSTQLVAMSMPGSATGKISVTNATNTGISATNFIVIINSPPSIQQGAKLVGTGGIPTPLQGDAVALSADGNTAAIGAPGDNGGVGAVWIFTRSGDTWTQQVKLVSVDAVVNTAFGTSVSLSADGNTLVTGGAGTANRSGLVWVFTRSGSTWTQQGAKLAGTGTDANSIMGSYVGVSADGNTFVAGGPGDNNATGAAWIFIRTAGAWSQQGSKLVGTGGVGPFGGQGKTSISADGNTISIGGPNDNTGAGAVWIFTRSGAVWTQQGAKLVCAESNANFGSSVALSADGNTLAAGALGIYVFTRTGTVWSQQGAKLVGTGAVGGNVLQGGSCGISADGNTVIETGMLDNSDIGAAWVFHRSDIFWSQAGSKLVGTGYVMQPHVGPCAMSADGNTAITGGPTDGGEITGSGASWIWISPSIANGALPVNLIDFNGRNNGAVNLLEWTTSAEQNSASFELQRSSDAVAFTPVASIRAAGNSAVERVYSYSDNTGAPGQAVYYRLKLIDIDGRYKYSAVLKINADLKGFSMAVSPNPFVDQLRINVTATTLESGSASLQDINGKAILQQHITLKTGSNLILVAGLDKIPAGVYMLTIKTNIHQQTFKLVK